MCAFLLLFFLRADHYIFNLMFFFQFCCAPSRRHYLSIQILVIVSCRGTAFLSAALQEFGEAL